MPQNPFYYNLKKTVAVTTVPLRKIKQIIFHKVCKLCFYMQTESLIYSWMIKQFF